VNKIAKEHLIDFSIAINPSYQDTWFHEALAEVLERAILKVEQGEDVRIIIECPPQHGKEISHETPILTTRGWITHGEIKVGDYVYGRDGSPVRVKNIWEEVMSEYDVEFSDGTIIQCHGNHEWVVFDRKQRKERTLETKYMASQQVWNGVYGSRGGRGRFQVDSNVPISGKKIDLPIPPYTLGAWLGDGTSTSNCITHHPLDFQTAERIEKDGFKQTAKSVHKDTGCIRAGFKTLYARLKNEKLFNNKRIPDVYFRSSIKQRLELLAGLIDTDGYVYQKNGRIVFSGCDKKLIDDVRRLIISLGMRVSKCSFKPILSSSGIQGKKIVYQLGFNPNMEIPTVIPRKKINKTNFKERKRSIVSIRRSKNPRLGRCITVDGGVYLVGDTFIPTHNSQIATQNFPAWVLGKHPDWPVMVGSYSGELAVGFGQQTRDIMLSQQYQDIFTTRLKADTKAKGKWATDEGGSYTAAGAGGVFTGLGFKIGIVDDPFKNREEAESQTIRDSRWNWYKSTFYTRQRGNTAIIVINTRWHTDDLVGRLINKQEEDLKNGVENYDKWEVIKFEAIATKDEKNRKRGEALWPERFPIEKLRKTENTLGPYEFSALYQQEPITSENQEFKQNWVKKRTITEVDALDTRKFATIDPGGKELENDYTGIVRNYVDREGKWNIRAMRVHIDSKELIDHIFTLYGEGFEKIGIEETVYLKALKPFFDDECIKRGRYPNIVPLKHNTTQKEVRIRGLIPRYSVGAIFHIEGYCADLETEMFVFPKGSHDDTIDALAMQNEIAEAPDSVLREREIDKTREEATDPSDYGLDA